MRYVYQTRGTCSRQIALDLVGDVVTNVEFAGGCEGNLAAIAKLVEGFTVQEIEEKLRGNTCGHKNTSCADQLAMAVRQAQEQEKERQ